MLHGEMRALGGLAGRAIGGPATLASELHGAVAERTFGALGVLGLPARVIHDGVSRVAYRSVSAALRAPLEAGAAAVAAAGGASDTPLAHSPAGRIALGALNGAFGDTLAEAHADLALELVVPGRDGQEIATDSEGLAAAFPDAKPRIAVFVHGLCETEDAWRLLPLGRGGRERGDYGTRLRDELGYTPLYVRYNTGLRISDNGRRLAQVIQHVVGSWPVELGEVVLVGHSMGGLVARSACHYGAAAEHDWTARVRHVFCLGTPHLGAPLERAANRVGWALARLPETRPIAALVNGRSAGIKDLRFGSCVEEDWCDCHPDELLNDRCREVPFLPHAAYYFVGATLTRKPGSGLGGIVGDLLVQFPSASGDGPRRRIPFEVDNGCHVGGVNHLQLLNHPAVYDQIRTWIERDRDRRALPAAAGAG